MGSSVEDWLGMAASTPAKYGNKGANMGWAGPAIMAGGSVAGAALGGKAAKKQAEIQAKSQQEALNFAREQDKYSRSQYEQALQIWDANRRQFLSRLGIELPPAQISSTPMGSMQMGVPMSAGQPVRGVTGTTLQPAMQPTSTAPADYTISGEPGMNLADVIRSRGKLGNAFDWRGAGLE